MVNAVLDVVQDAPFGRVLRYLSRGKLFAFPEDHPDFKIPWEEASAGEKEKAIETAVFPDQNASRLASNATIPPAVSREPSQSMLNHEDIEARPLSTIPTAHSSARSDFGPVTTRTKTREQTLPYSRERFEIEQEEAIERQQSNVIAPQRTSDGVILVDWYTTDDPANPQNWNSWKKAWVGFVIFMYTFMVYMASAIYTSAAPQVMTKFNVSSIVASLGLSLYVLGYGTGPM